MPKTKATSAAKNDPVVEVNVPEGFGAFVTPLAILFSAVIVAVAVIYAGGKLENKGTALGTETQTDTTAQDDNTAAQTDDTGSTAGTVVRQYETFTEYDNEICKQDGKPVIYLFSTTWCPHCKWIHDTFDNWAKANADKVVVYHWQVDTNDNTLTDAVETEIPAEMMAIYQKFNPNQSIPTFVFGCRYARIGNGYESEDNLEKETQAYDKIVEELLK